MCVCVSIGDVQISISTVEFKFVNLSTKLIPNKSPITQLTGGSDNGVGVAATKGVDVSNSLLHAVNHFHSALLTAVLLRELNTLRIVHIL